MPDFTSYGSCTISVTVVTAIDSIRSSIRSHQKLSEVVNFKNFLGDHAPDLPSLHVLMHAMYFG